MMKWYKIDALLLSEKYKTKNNNKNGEIYYTRYVFAE